MVQPADEYENRMRELYLPVPHTEFSILHRAKEVLQPAEWAAIPEGVELVKEHKWNLARKGYVTHLTNGSGEVRHRGELRNVSIDEVWVKIPTL